MNDTYDDELQLWYALYRLEAKHWYDVDFNGGRRVHDFYCPDGQYIVGPNRFEGQKGIRTFYDWRRSRGEMSSRHIISNFVVQERDGRRARASGLITTHCAKGGPPVEYGNVPALVSDFTSEYVLGNDEVWRYMSHRLDPVFIGKDTPLSLAIDPQYLASPRARETTDR
jgi:hypothetical protein